MPMMQTRRRFLTTLSLAGAAGLVRAPRALAAEGAARNHLGAPREDPGHLHCAAIRRRGAAARGGFHRYPLCRCVANAERHRSDRRTAKSDFSCIRGLPLDRQAIDAGAPITVLAGVHVGCYELFAQSEHPQHRRPEGQERRRAGSGRPARCSSLDGGPCRARPDQGYPLGHQTPSVKPIELFVEGKIDAFLAFPPEPQDLRARQIGHVIVNSRRRPPLVAVFLLHAGGQPGVCPQISGRDQARAARHPQGSRSLRHRAGAGRATARRWRLYPSLRLCPADAERDPLRQMAGIRPRGHDPLLRLAPARSRASIKIEPAEDHRRTAPIGASRTSSNAS